MFSRIICLICLLSAAACSNQPLRTEARTAQGSVTESQTPITQDAKRVVGDVIIVEMDKEALSAIETKIQKLFSQQKSGEKNQPQIKLNLANNAKAGSRAPASVDMVQEKKNSAGGNSAPVRIDLAGVASMPFQVREILADGTMRMESRHPLVVGRKLCEVTIAADLAKDALGVGNSIHSSAMTAPQYKVGFDSISLKKYKAK